MDASVSRGPARTPTAGPDAAAALVGPAPPRRAGLPLPFRGRLVVAGAFLVTMVGYGAIYSYPAFAEEIAAEFGASRSSVTLVYVLSGSSCFFVSAISGPLSDRIGPRVVAAAGMLLVGLGLVVAAAARSLVERVCEKGQAGARRFSMRRMAAMSIIASDVCSSYS